MKKVFINKPFRVGSKDTMSKSTDLHSSIIRPEDKLSYFIDENDICKTCGHEVVELGPVGTSTKQLSGYFTIAGIQNETTALEKDWPLFAFKENSDNAWDWLNDFYSTDVAINRRYRY